MTYTLNKLSPYRPANQLPQTFSSQPAPTAPAGGSGYSLAKGVTESPFTQNDGYTPVRGQQEAEFNPMKFAWTGPTNAPGQYNEGRVLPPAPQGMNGYSLAPGQQPPAPSSYAPAAQAAPAEPPAQVANVGSQAQYRRMGSDWMPSQQAAQGSFPGATR